MAGQVCGVSDGRLDVLGYLMTGWFCGVLESKIGMQGMSDGKLCLQMYLVI